MSAFVCLESKNDFIVKLHDMVEKREITMDLLLDHGFPSWYANVIMTKRTNNQISSDFLEKLSELTQISVVDILMMGGLISKHAVRVAKGGLVPKEVKGYLTKDEINIAGADLQEDLDRIRKEVKKNELEHEPNKGSEP